jgi:ribonuclease R
MAAKGRPGKAQGGHRDLRREILGVFERSPRKPINHKQVASSLGITDAGIRTLIFQILQEEAVSGKLKEVERGKFVLTQAAETTVMGYIDINRYGKGYVKVEGQEMDVEIAKGDTGFALYGDLVEISFTSRSRRPRGRVVRVVERLRKQYVGVIEMNKQTAFMVPGDRRMHVDFFIPKDDLNGAKHGDKVIVELTKWDRPESSPNGRVSKVLGKPGLHEVEMHAIIAEYGLPYEFPKAVEDFAEAIDPGFTPEEIARRKDFRDVLTFTIDPFDAKDFDDALSFRKLGDNRYEVGVHIADVSFYLKPGTILEDEALSRATSVYLVDRTIPMLPERLSNELCSLRPNEDKMCYSAVFEMNDQAEVLKEWFGRTVIHSDRRYTYEEAQEIIETGKGDHAEEILLIDKLAKTLRERRFAEGSIDFNSDEVKFKLDETGFPLGVYIKKMKDSNQLIEDFMLLANRRVAAFIGKPSQGQAKTFVYRIHDQPDPEKLNKLRNFLKNIGYKLQRPTDSDSHYVIKELMKRVAGEPEEDVIRQMAIRSMAKAEYSTHNIGHYGLAFDFYTHFTSPIRRYPDVMVHRLLQRYLEGGGSVDERDFDLKCRHSSLMEKRAAEAERASIKYKQVEFMLMHREKVFQGIISGIASWGFYVEVIENKCEGLVAANTLKDDLYEFNPDKYILRGVRRHREFHMGDEVMVKVTDGDLQQRTLNFELLEA